MVAVAQVSLKDKIKGFFQNLYTRDLNTSAPGMQSIQDFTSKVGRNNFEVINPLSQFSLQKGLSTASSMQQMGDPLNQFIGGAATPLLSYGKSFTNNMSTGTTRAGQSLMRGDILGTVKGVGQAAFGVGQAALLGKGVTSMAAMTPRQIAGNLAISGGLGGGLQIGANAIGLAQGKQVGLLDNIASGVGQGVGMLPATIGSTAFTTPATNRILTAFAPTMGKRAFAIAGKALFGIENVIQNRLASDNPTAQPGYGDALAFGLGAFKGVPNKDMVVINNLKRDVIETLAKNEDAIRAEVNTQGRTPKGEIGGGQYGQKIKGIKYPSGVDPVGEAIPLFNAQIDNKILRVTPRQIIDQKIDVSLLEPINASAKTAWKMLGQQGSVDLDLLTGGMASKERLRVAGKQEPLPGMETKTNPPFLSEPTEKTRLRVQQAAEGAGLRTADDHLKEWQKAVFQDSKAQTKKQRTNALVRTMERSVKENTVGDLPALDSVESKPRSSTADMKDFVKSLALTTRKILNDMGTFGKEASSRIDRYYNDYRVGAGNDVADYLNITRKIDDASFPKIAQFLDGKPVTLSADEMVVAKALRDKLNTTGRRAQGARLTIERADGTKVEWQPRENYFPHYIDEAKLKQYRQETIAHLVGTKQFKNTGEAASFVDDLIRGDSLSQAYHKYFPNTAPRSYGHLELSRMLDLPTEVLRYDKKVMADYLAAANRRLAQANIFGPKNEGVKQILDGIAREGGDAELAQRAFDANFGVLPRSAIDRVSGTVRSFQAATKLPLAAISNVGQTVNTATVTGIGPTLKAIFKSASPESQDFALRTGTILDSSLRDIQDQIGQQDGPLSKLTAPFFKNVETFNRVVATNAGKNFIEDQFAKLMDNPNNTGARKAFEKLGIDPTEALARGALSQDELIRGAQNIVDRTQFKVDQIDLPPSWDGAWGKIITQFKSFSYKQGEFIAREVLKEAKNGNLAPLTKYLLLGAVVGEGIADVKALVGNRERPEDIKSRIAENISSVGGVGIPADIYRAITGGSDDMASLILGPTLGEPVRLAKNIADFKKYGDATGLIKEGMYLIPLVGSTAAKWVFPGYQAPKIGKNIVAGDTPEKRSEQTSAIEKKLNAGKKVETSELMFTHFYEADQLPEGSYFNEAKKRDAYLKEYQKIVDDKRIPDEQKAELINHIAEKVGVTAPQMAYYDLATETEDNKYAFAMDKIEQIESNGGTRQQLLQMLLLGRTKVNDKMLMSDGVISRLEDDGYISKEEAKFLRATTLGGKGGIQSSYNKGSGKAPKAKAPPKLSIPKSSTSTPSFGKMSKGKGITLQKAPKAYAPPVSASEIKKRLRVKI